MNSRIDHRNAQALVGRGAFVRAVPMGQAPVRCESEDRSPPGGRRV